MNNTMATYTAVICLWQDLEQLMSSYSLDRGFPPFTKEEIEILYQAVTLMDSLLLDSSCQSYDREVIMNPIMEERITRVLRKAGIFVDFWEVHFLPVIGVFSGFRINTTREEGPSITEITEEIVSINEELEKISDGSKNVQELEPTSSTDKSSTYLSPSRRTPNTEGKLVGLEDDMVTMLDGLTGHPSQLKVFPIVGMAGIGKTTFSRKLYDNHLVMHHFHIRAWVTVSQQYQAREVLIGILRCVAGFSDEIDGRSNEEICEKVYRSLKGKRYLIVMDDMWDTKAWDDLKRIFPDDTNGSRVMLTSRLADVAVYASRDAPHNLRHLSADESWELLCSKVFVDKSCPVELVEIGKQISYKCKGLPLAIVVLGGLLSKMNRKREVWEKVARSVGSLVMEETENCQNILALSYNHLPDYLKVCFLYMGMFPEDYEISVKKLIWLWVAEGFIEPSVLKSLEEVAEDYLEDLITRSLVLVKAKGCDGRIKTCYIHDLMRELCLRESQKVNFLHVVNNSGQLPMYKPLDEVLLHLGFRDVPPNCLHNLRRISFHSSIRAYMHCSSFPYTRSVMCFERLVLSDPRSDLGMNFKLLKVLDLMNIHLRVIPEDIRKISQLKFLTLTIKNSWEYMFSFVLHEFRSLQTLIVDCEWDGYLPWTFWDMVELRHFHMKRSCRSYSRVFISQSPLELELDLELRVLNNLTSLSAIRPRSCNKKGFLTMPHLKKLGVHETEEDRQYRGWFKTLVHLRELETLKYVFSNPFISPGLKPDRLPSWDKFPPNIMKLTLSGTSFPWEDMNKLSMLPKLEVLKLRNYAFSGSIWKCSEGGFSCLKFLLIGSTNLEIWEADGTCFPKLERLVLRHCRSLKEIPCGVFEAPLMEKIELHCCKDSAVISARLLQEEQESLGNDVLTIHITEG